MVKQHTCGRFVHRFTNHKFEIFIYGDKFLWNWLSSSSYDAIYYSQTKIEMFQPKKLAYSNLKLFDSDQFKLDIFNSMSDVRTHAAFENNFVSILDKHAPKNTKLLWENQMPHFNRNLQKQIMLRSRLKNKTNNSKNPIDIVKFKRQRNKVANLNKQAKFQHFEKPSVDCN